MNIDYKNIKLRPAQVDDASILLAWWNDGEIMEILGYPKGMATNETIIKHRIDHDRLTYRHIIEIDKQAVGQFAYRDLYDGSVDLTIHICESSYQNQGYGSQILGLVIDHIFNIEGFNKISLSVSSTNARAIHVFEKLGFEKIKEQAKAFSQDQTKTYYYELYKK